MKKVMHVAFVGETIMYTEFCDEIYWKVATSKIESEV
jgi:hypothetical protein